VSAYDAAVWAAILFGAFAALCAVLGLAELLLRAIAGVDRGD